MIGRRSLVASLLVAAATVLVACAASSGSVSHRTTGGAEVSSSRSSDDAPSRAVTSRRSVQPPAAATCTTVPVSSGPLARVARLAIDAPATASATQPMSVATTVTATAATERVITAPEASAVLLVRDGRVVARAIGSARGSGIPLQLRAGARAPAQAVPRSIPLVTCGPGAKLRLATGSYTIVAVLGYRLDPLNAAANGADGPSYAGGRDFALVSPPLPITLR